MSNFSWTPELRDEVKRLFLAGETPGSIWQVIGAPSRNAVCGVLHRMGFKRGAKPCGGGRRAHLDEALPQAPSGPGSELELEPVAKVAKFEDGHRGLRVVNVSVSRLRWGEGQSSAASASPLPPTKLVPLPAILSHKGGRGEGKALAWPQDPRAEPPHPDLQLQGISRPLPLAETEKLTDARCRWPLGDPLTPEFRWCGGACLGKNPDGLNPRYCHTHAALAKSPGAHLARSWNPAWHAREGEDAFLEVPELVPAGEDIAA